MDREEKSLIALRQDIIDNNLHVKAIIQVSLRTRDSPFGPHAFHAGRFSFRISFTPFSICAQDITSFRGSLEELNNFNEAGRAKLAILRKCIERLDDYAADANSPELSSEVDSHRQQFSR